VSDQAQTAQRKKNVNGTSVMARAAYLRKYMDVAITSMASTAASGLPVSLRASHPTSRIVPNPHNAEGSLASASEKPKTENKEACIHSSSGVFSMAG
jgi:hypothetical protein